ncbi:MAG: glycosyltransferase [Leptolyngbyaceae cyanobacterium]
MQILAVHNYYQQFGGEDVIFTAETDLLESHGHNVYRYTLHNDQIKTMSSWSVAKDTLWNHQVYQELRSLAAQIKPDIVHFHNTFPLVSPAAYYAVKAAGIPVVQTLNNYRLLCPNALFLRNGNVCEDCLGKVLPWPGTVHGCYQNNRAASSVVAAMLTTHRLLHTWVNMVDVYVANLTEFARDKFIQAGIPPDKIVIKPNFVDPDPGVGQGQGGYALFVGRLSPEKGIATLLSAWKQMKESRIPLKIVGDGPLASEVGATVNEVPDVEWLGKQPLQTIYALMKDATFLVFPSQWYEGLPRTIVESFAVGTPIIASNLGAMSSLIRHGVTGLHFEAGSSTDLLAQVEWAVAHPQEIAGMRQAARAEYEEKYTAEINYRKLIVIYNRILGIST